VERINLSQEGDDLFRPQEGADRFLLHQLLQALEGHPGDPLGLDPPTEHEGQVPDDLVGAGIGVALGLLNW